MLCRPADIFPLLLLGGWLAPACGRPSEPPPHVVIIVMDTVRADVLSTHGAPARSSPVHSALAEEAWVFENAYSTSTWTAPAHASLFTGLHSVAHHTTQERWNLGTDQETMAELLAARGFRTVALVENPVVSKANAFDQGFDAFHELWRGTAGAAGKGLLQRFERELDGIEDGVPLFAFVNLIGAHSPYRPPARYGKRHVTDRTLRVDRNDWGPFYMGEREFEDAELRHMQELYGAEAEFVDFQVGRLVRALRERGLLDNTLLVITSDHGENIGHHGQMDHVFSLYESTVHIPLLVRYPPLFPGEARVEEPVQLTDILSTVLSATGTPEPASGLQGQPLFEPDPERVVFCEYYRPLQAKRALERQGVRIQEDRMQLLDRRLRSITQGDLKLIWGSDGRHELYDLAQDPGESSNLIDHPGSAAHLARLERLLFATVARYQRASVDDPADSGAALDEKTEAALQALGYL